MITLINKTSKMSQSKGMEVKSIMVGNGIDLYDDLEHKKEFNSMTKAKKYARKLYKKYSTEDIITV